MGSVIITVFIATTAVIRVSYLMFNKAMTDFSLCVDLNFYCEQFDYFKYLHYYCYYYAAIKEQYSLVITVNQLIIAIADC